ncbi:MAG: GAF domain-containing protein [Nannocystaceae bacterium]|nr:GAF domain-containing protein [Nannocystaceae bacterium]
MTHDGSGPTLEAQTQAFLREFFAKGEQLVRELIEENDRLRLSLSAGANPTADSSRTIERLARQIELLEAECAELRRVAAGVQDRGGTFRDRLDDLEREHYRLAAMYVAGSQFHLATTIDDVLRTLTEILLNFVGVGRFTVYVVDEERQMLFPLMREGETTAELEELPLPGEGPLGDVTGLGRPWHPGAPRGAGPGVLMQLPLCSGTRLVGLVRIERLLPQKAELGDADGGLLELVSEHAGVGIETAWIRAHAREVPLQRAALERLVGS